MFWNRCLHLTLLLALGASATMLTGCNTSARYRVLSTVFDGVPHPDEALQEVPAPEGASLEDAAGRLALLPTRYTHPSAGTEGGCALCHGPPKQLIIPGKDMCVRCHAHVTEKKLFIHGPAVLDCIVCHEPHESRTKTLLKITGNELCYECHYRQNRDDAYKTDEHRDLDEGAFVCLACHDPHGGKDRFFVKDDQGITKQDSTDGTPQEGGLEEPESREGLIQGENRENGRNHQRIPTDNF